MKTIEINLYQFSELSKEGQDTVIEKQYDLNVNSDQWHDYIQEDAKEIGKLMGIDIEKIYFSGFSSQGDGACFEGYYSYMADAYNKVKAYAPKDETVQLIAASLQVIQERNNYELYAKIKHSGHYYHEFCTDIDVDVDNNSAVVNMENELKDELRKFMKWIYTNLNKEYDYLTSREAIIETIEANEYTFESDGTMNNG